MEYRARDLAEDSDDEKDDDDDEPDEGNWTILY